MNLLPATLSIAGGQVELRRSVADDLPALIALLAADARGSSREASGVSGDLQPYRLAFQAIDADPAQLLVSAVASEQVVGTLQLTFIPGLSRRGALRGQVEAVRVHADFRSRGLGGAMFDWAIEEARRRGCHLLQLTTDKTRHDAHRFYHRLGFVPSHEGFKLEL